MATAKKISETQETSLNDKKSLTSGFLNFGSWRKNIAKSYGKRPNFYKGGFVLVLIIVVLGTILWFNKGLIVAGNVNGQIVTTPQFYNKLVKADGTAVFDSLVQEILIKQEASKKRIKATKEDIDKKVAEIEKGLGGKENLDVALTQNNTTMEQLRDQLEIQILVEKILADQIKIADSEITKYIADNKATNPDITRDQAQQQVKNQKLSDKFTTWYNDLKAKAKIYKFF